MNEPYDLSKTANLRPPADPLSADPNAGQLPPIDLDATLLPDQPSSVDRPRANQAPAIGLADNPGYRVLREIARGGMGRVVAAHDLGLDREVAIKVLLPGADAGRFVRESRITARLPHPGIPPV